MAEDSGDAPVALEGEGLRVKGDGSAADCVEALLPPLAVEAPPLMPVDVSPAAVPGDDAPVPPLGMEIDCSTWSNEAEVGALKGISTLELSVPAAVAAVMT